MATRASLTRSSGQVITSAGWNSMRDHIVPYTGADDVTTEGQIGVNTSTDRLVIHDGTASRRLSHYTASGRTGFAATAPSSPIGSGVQAQLPFTTITSDSDGFYTGWTGSVYGITIPASLAGLYSVTLHMFTNVGLSGGAILSFNTSTLDFQAPTPAGRNWGTMGFVVPMSGGQLNSVSVTNLHSASANFDVRIFLYRLAI